MNFCSNCGASLIRKIPQGDNRERHVCPECDAIHYQNPKIVAGCIPEWEGKVLLCRRAIEPRYGRWTLPAGFMENDETAAEAASRETLEEANARVEILSLYTLFNLPHINQVYMLFRSRMLDVDFTPGKESLEVELFEVDAIPWEELAFPTIVHTLEYYQNDVQRGAFEFRMGDIVRAQGRAQLVDRR